MQEQRVGSLMWSGCRSRKEALWNYSKVQAEAVCPGQKGSTEPRPGRLLREQHKGCRTQPSSAPCGLDEGSIPQSEGHGAWETKQTAVKRSGRREKAFKSKRGKPHWTGQLPPHHLRSGCPSIKVGYRSKKLQRSVKSSPF